jgi:hypothetical protein
LTFAVERERLASASKVLEAEVKTAETILELTGAKFSVGTASIAASGVRELGSLLGVRMGKGASHTAQAEEKEGQFEQSSRARGRVFFFTIYSPNCSFKAAASPKLQTMMTCRSCDRLGNAIWAQHLE